MPSSPATAAPSRRGRRAISRCATRCGSLSPACWRPWPRACGAAGYCIEEPAQCEEVLREAFAQPGPAVIEAVVDANEPPLPGRIKTQEAMRFSQALLKGQPDKWAIVSNAMKDVIGQK